MIRGGAGGAAPRAGQPGAWARAAGSQPRQPAPAPRRGRAGAADAAPGGVPHPSLVLQPPALIPHRSPRQVKAEIQALSSFGFQYLSQQYLPLKLQEGDWI